VRLISAKNLTFSTARDDPLSNRERTQANDCKRGLRANADRERAGNAKRMFFDNSISERIPTRIARLPCGRFAVCWQCVDSAVKRRGKRVSASAAWVKPEKEV
jgi:hypothetical protein